MESFACQVHWQRTIWSLNKFTMFSVGKPLIDLNFDWEKCCEIVHYSVRECIKWVCVIHQIIYLLLYEPFYSSTRTIPMKYVHWWVCDSSRTLIYLSFSFAIIFLLFFFLFPLKISLPFSRNLFLIIRFCCCCWHLILIYHS